MYAVIETGGKQYRVSPGDHLLVEKLPGNAGDKVVFDRVLLVVDNEDVHIGRPLVQGAVVEGTILAQTRGPKIIVFKYKPKKRYRRKQGHRQYYTEVLIDRIALKAEPEQVETSEATAEGAEE